MSKNHYKVFFTMSFLYRIDSKKKVSKSFKSDLDINDKLLNQSLDDNNVHKKWKEYALKTPIDKLNPASNFNNDYASEKSIVTHRIVNLMNLTEVHET
tara:strand:- start:4062 stop:4355 length:294 start_codon:yes stop_codon:yes gene_type:complete